MLWFCHWVQGCWFGCFGVSWGDLFGIFLGCLLGSLGFESLPDIFQWGGSVGSSFLFVFCSFGSGSGLVFCGLVVWSLGCIFGVSSFGLCMSVSLVRVCIFMGLSWNVCGLSKVEKRGRIMNLLRHHRVDLIFQETNLVGLPF